MSLSYLLQIESGIEAETGVEDVPVWDIIVDASQGFGALSST